MTRLGLVFLELALGGIGVMTFLLGVVHPVVRKDEASRAEIRRVAVSTGVRYDNNHPWMKFSFNAVLTAFVVGAVLALVYPGPDAHGGMQTRVVDAGVSVQVSGILLLAVLGCIRGHVVRTAVKQIPFAPDDATW